MVVTLSEESTLSSRRNCSASLLLASDEFLLLKYEVICWNGRHESAPVLETGIAEGPVGDVLGALDAAERAVVEVRAAAVRDRDLGALAELSDVWGEVTGRAFTRRLGAIVATV